MSRKKKSVEKELLQVFFTYKVLQREFQGTTRTCAPFHMEQMRRRHQGPHQLGLVSGKLMGPFPRPLYGSVNNEAQLSYLHYVLLWVFSSMDRR